MKLKKLVFLILFACIPVLVFSQVSVDPSDPIYTDISNWENLGIIHNVPPLRPYPLTLITSFLNTVMQSEYEDQAAKARLHYERIYGKSADVGFEVSDYYKRGNNKVDKSGKNGTKEKENELDVYLQAAGDVQATDFMSVGGKMNILVTTGLDKNPLPTFENKKYDSVNDPTNLKFAKAFLDMNVTAGIGNENLYFQGGISRNSFGPFYEDSVSLNPQGFHTGNASFVIRHNKWNYTQAMFILGATDDVGGHLSPNKFMMMHSFDYSPFKWLTVSYYENVVYGKRFDPIYLLPFVPYMVAQGIGSFNDNVQMGIAFKVKPRPGFAWLTDVFVDDLAMSDLVKLKWNTKFRFGAMTGFVYSPLNSPFTEISLNYTMITPYMYTHEQFADNGNSVGSTDANYQNYTNNGKSMGSNLPPNSDRISFKIKANPAENLSLTFGANMIRHSNINELIIDKSPEEAIKYLALPSPPGELKTDGSVLNHPYSIGAYQYAWNHFMFLQSATNMYTWQASLDASYSLPMQRFGKMTFNVGYTFEYIRNNGVQNDILPSGVYSADQAGLNLAYNNWKAALHDDIKHYFRISFKYLYGL
ncbi:MAG: hypothetical protein J5631_07930 [Spirochaetaceae bacterium]|nr:hypothetical protein [Spirochaetaceae bacterium]